MHPDILLQYFGGEISLADLVAAWEAPALVYPFRDMYTCYPVDSACLLPLAEAAVAGELGLDFLKALGEMLLASEQFDWGDDIAPEVCHFWAFQLSPEPEAGLTQAEQCRRRLAGQRQPLPE